MLRLAAEIGAPLVLMDHGADPTGLHTPHSVHSELAEDELDGSIRPPAIVGAVVAMLQQMQHDAAIAGVMPWQLIMDPGLGFAKDVDQSMELVRWLPHLKAAVGSAPMMLGPSRKRMTAAAVWACDETPEPPAFDARDWCAQPCTAQPRLCFTERDL